MDVNKGRALQVLAEILGFERPEIIAIGNYFNDIEMLQVANIGIAIANSPTEVRGQRTMLQPTPTMRMGFWKLYRNLFCSSSS